jgi:hypothetical protein
MSVTPESQPLVLKSFKLSLKDQEAALPSTKSESDRIARSRNCLLHLRRGLLLFRGARSRGHLSFGVGPERRSARQLVELSKKGGVKLSEADSHGYLHHINLAPTVGVRVRF